MELYNFPKLISLLFHGHLSHHFLFFTLLHTLFLHFFTKLDILSCNFSDRIVSHQNIRLTNICTENRIFFELHVMSQPDGRGFLRILIFASLNCCWVLTFPNARRTLPMRYMHALRHQFPGKRLLH